MALIKMSVERFPIPCQRLDVGSHTVVSRYNTVHYNPILIATWQLGKMWSTVRIWAPGGKLTSTQIITCVHTYAVAERRRSGSKIRSATNGSNTQFSASASKPRASNHLCIQEMADPPASAPRMCEHTRGSGAGMSKSARLRSATWTAPRMCERSFTVPAVTTKSSNWWSFVISDTVKVGFSVQNFYPVCGVTTRELSVRHA